MKTTTTTARQIPAKLELLISVRSESVANDAYTRTDVSQWLGIDAKTLRRWERRLRIYARPFRHRQEGEPLSNFQFWCLVELQKLLKETHGKNSDKMIAEIIANNQFTREKYHASERTCNRNWNQSNQTTRRNA